MMRGDFTDHVRSMTQTMTARNTAVSRLPSSHNPLHAWPFTFAFFLTPNPATNQYGRYGKTRAAEDARRYLEEKQELERERDGIRNVLVTLRQEKRELKEELKTASGEETRGREQTLHKPFVFNMTAKLC